MNSQIDFDEDNNFFGDEERNYVKNYSFQCNCGNRMHIMIQKLMEKEHELKRAKEEIELIKLVCLSSSDSIKKKLENLKKAG